MDTSWIIPTIAVAIAFGSLWWKMTTNMATKDDIATLRAELQADIREIRQMLFSHISDHHKHEYTKQSNPHT